MAKTKQTVSVSPNVTRAEKRDGAKKLIRELLQNKTAKASELIDEAAKVYAERFSGEDTENPNDVKGRIGSVLDVMKKDGDVTFEGGMYALNASASVEKPVQEATNKAEEKPAKKTTRTRVKKVAEAKEEAEKPAEKAVEEKPKKTTAKKKKDPLPAAPLQPIAPTAPITPEIAPEPIPKEEEKAAAPKKRGRKAKAEMVEEKPQEKQEEQPQEQPIEKVEEAVKGAVEEKKEEKKAVALERVEDSPKGTLMDVSFLLEKVKGVTTVEDEEIKKLKPLPNPEKTSAREKAKPQAKEQEKVKPQTTKPQTEKMRIVSTNKPTRIVTVKKPLTADEKLQAAFLSRLHRLGGEYFEYYSVYLLEKYSRKNGRRLESLRISAGDHDGGIDGEIELTDRLGFRETIYIQSKNWDPDKGDEKLWVVGETLLQQFIGACVCRQAKDGKQNCRGIFITTSRFTPEAKRILQTAPAYVGYDGADVYEAAKECEFGIIKKNGEWALDEQLLSGEKAFFNLL